MSNISEIIAYLKVNYVKTRTFNAKTYQSATEELQEEFPEATEEEIDQAIVEFFQMDTLDLENIKVQIEEDEDEEVDTDDIRRMMFPNEDDEIYF